MKMLTKKNILILLAVIEIVLTAGLAGKCLLADRYTETFGAEGREIPFLETAIPLNKGYYQITVDYTADGDSSYCRTASKMSYGMSYGEEAALDKEKKQKIIEAELKEDTEVFYLELKTGEMEYVQIHSVTLQETRRMDVKNTLLLVCVFLILDMFLVLHEQRIWVRLTPEQKQTGFGLAVICLFASVPLFVNYLIEGHDLLFHLMRIEGIADGLRAGEFPVKMQSNWLNGYGYPVSVMYGDILLYIPAMLRILGFTLQDAYKIYVFLMNITTVLLAYYCGKEMTESRGLGLTGSFLYSMSSYRIVNLYYRSSVGEYSAMAFLPLIFLGWYLLFRGQEKDRKKGMLCMIFGYTLVLQTHLLTFEMAIIFSAFYCLIHFKKFWENLILLLKTAFITIVMNLGFLVPLLDYMHSHDLKVEYYSAYNVQENGIFLAQLFQMLSFGGSVSAPVSNGIMGDMPLGLGLPLILLLLLFAGEYLAYGTRLKEKNGSFEWKQQMTFFVLALLGILMSCWFFPWNYVEKIPLVGKTLCSFQFAWRFLIIATVLSVIVGMYTIRNLGYLVTKERKMLIAFGICMMTFIASSYLMDCLVSQSPVKKYTGTAGISTVWSIGGGEYLLPGVDMEEMFDLRVYAGDGVIVNGYVLGHNEMLVYCQNTTETESWLKVPLLAYKGYAAKDVGSGAELSITATDTNVVKVLLPAGYEGELRVYFKQSIFWRMAELLSFAAFLGVIFWWRRGRYTKEGEDTGVMKWIRQEKEPG